LSDRQDEAGGAAQYGSGCCMPRVIFTFWPQMKSKTANRPTKQSLGCIVSVVLSPLYCETRV
jgi:hypothetical protein